MADQSYAAPNANPRMPADHGLPALGLLMKLQAGFFLIYGGLFIFQLMVAGGSGGFGGGAEIFAMLGAVVVGLVRGFVHLGAARLVTMRSPASLQAVRRYVVTASITTLLTALLVALAVPGFPVTLVLGLTVVMMFWPVTLAVLVLMRPSIRRMFETAETFDVELIPGDRSIEGAGVLMTYLGAVGLALGVYATFAFATSGGLRGLGIFFFIALLVLVARGAIHLTAGVRAMGGLTPGAFTGRIDTYFGLAVVSVTVIAISVLVISGGQNLLGTIVALVLLTALLVLWPTILRGFAQQTLMDDLGDVGGTIAFGPAPDRGLTALGYMLVLFGGAQAALWLVQLLAVGPGLMLPGVGHSTFDALSGPDLWITPIIAATTLWAGRELVLMSDRYRLAAVVFAAVQIGGTSLSWLIGGFPLDGADGIAEAPIVVLSLVVTMIVPILALVLTRRRLPVAARQVGMAGRTL